jgi:hypothetical protein
MPILSNGLSNETRANHAGSPAAATEGAGNSR